MVIINFITINPTYRLMEVMSDWCLNLRTESDLVQIALDARLNRELISIEKEQLNINLFPMIRKK